MRAIYAIVFILLSACATKSPEEVTVKWIRMPPAEVHKECAKHQGNGPTVIGHNRACAVWYRESGYCVIWAADFNEVMEREKMASLGHELKHCFDGPWHR